MRLLNQLIAFEISPRQVEFAAELLKLIFEAFPLEWEEKNSINLVREGERAECRLIVKAFTQDTENSARIYSKGQFP